MQKGGYQIIDLKGKTLTSGVSMQYEGLYEKIEGTRKAILLSGLYVDGVEYHDCFVQPVVNSDAYDLIAYGKTIRVYDTDVVTVNPSNQEG